MAFAAGHEAAGSGAVRHVGLVRARGRRARRDRELQARLRRRGRDLDRRVRPSGRRAALSALADRRPPPPRCVRAMTDAPAGWDEGAARGPGGHVMQSSAWAALREAQGWRAEYLRPAGAHALVLWRPLPGGMRFGYCPRGPVATAAQLPDALRALAAHAKAARGALVIKVDPERTVDEAGAALAGAGFRRGPDIQPVIST